MKKSWKNQAVRESRIAGIKKSWTRERKKAQAAAVAKLMADPEASARRLAGLRRTLTDPELSARRVANLQKALSDPAVRRKRIRNLRKTLHTPEMNARRSASMKTRWATLREGNALIAEAHKTGKDDPGRKQKKESARALELKRQGLSYPQIARKIYPDDYARSEEKASERVRKAVKRAEKSEARRSVPQRAGAATEAADRSDSIQADLNGS